MLRILCGEEPKDLLNTATRLFRSENVNDWFNDPIIEEIVLDVDKTSHIHDKVFESPVLGTITADSLSGGVKGLILIMKSDYIEDGVPMRSSIFGDNCVKWLIKLSFTHDFTIYMSHFLNFCFDDGILDIDPRNTPINAIGRNGEKLSTCGEVIKYYLHIHAQEPDAKDLFENETFERVHLSPEDTVGTHEYYLARKDKCPYLTDATDPVTIKKMDIIDKISHSKSEEELTQLREQLNALYRS